MPLAILVWAVAAITAVAVLTRYWWMPPAINDVARDFDSHLNITLALVGAIFVAAQMALGWAIFRFRARGTKASHSAGDNRLEALWTSATVVMFLGIALVGMRIFTGVQLDEPPGDALRVEVLGRQFAWSFRYAGRDGEFGRLDPNQISDAGGNPFGVDFTDPAGRDDIVVSALRIPVDTPVVLALTSRDVIHNFFVRELRLKQDLVPGMTIPLTFEAEAEGMYEVACSELCGLGHHQMRTVVEVLSPRGYEDWLLDMDDQLAQQLGGQ